MTMTMTMTTTMEPTTRRNQQRARALPSSSSSSTAAAAAALLSASALLAGCCTHGFVPPLSTASTAARRADASAGPASFSSAFFPASSSALFRRPSAARRMSADVEPDQEERTSASDDDDDDDDEPWWKSFALSDASLPAEIRSDFPILSTRIGAEGTPESEKKDLVYLDSAATSQKPLYVTDALTRYYHTSNSNVHRGAHCLSREATSQYEGSRDAVAKFVNANSRNEIVFTSGATEAMNLVANSYGRSTLKAGDEVIITELEHHSNIVPWQLICEETGATLKYIPVNKETQTLDMDVFRTLVNENTKIVSVQHVSNVLGCVHPIPDLVSFARANASPDCKILVDACQSCPHMPVDVQSLDIDFLAGSGHKMCGPTGIGFLWGREDVLNSMPPFLGGGEMIDDVSMDGSTFAKAPARFEAGTPAIAQAVGMGAAVEYVGGVGIERIESYEHELGTYLYRRLEEMPGVTPLGPKPDEATGGRNRVGLVSFVCDAVHPSDLSTFLDMEGVAVRAGHHCCQPLHKALGYSHSARASLYFYNTKEEIDYFVEKLEETLAFFGSVSGEGAGDADGDGEDDFVPFV